MTCLTPLPLRATDFVTSGSNDRALRRMVENHEMVRIRRGLFVPVAAWSTISARDRHVVRARAQWERLGGDVVLSHWSAAAVWGLPVPDDWPARTEVVDRRRLSNTSTRVLRRYAGPLDDSEVDEWMGVRITTAVRTVADLAVSSPFDHAVIVLDHALREGLVTKAAVHDALENRGEQRRSRSARAPLAFADPRAASPAESFSRVGIHVRGLPAPDLQVPYHDEDGEIGIVDFAWPQFGVIGECDGDVKYDDPAYRNGRTAAEVVRDEKARQARLEALRDVRRVVRWDYAMSRNPNRLAQHLIVAGVVR